MSVAYVTIGWNRQKRIYDAVVLSGVAVFLAMFVIIGLTAFPPDQAPSITTLFIRALGTCAILMLHIVLWIGPLCRLDKRFLPLLYNRRHLGVVTFLVGLAHGALSILIYHGFGDVSPLRSLLTSNTEYGSLSRFPFEILGLAALIILFLMAATSHDFWLKNLSPRWWKRLHMSVYFAYAPLIMHIALGFLQQETHPLYASLLGAGLVITLTLHLAAGIREVRRDRGQDVNPDGLIDAAALSDIPPDRAIIVCPRSGAGRSRSGGGGERIAIFRNGDALSAVSNICEHQQGPLGEGKVIDGCITCPWHGYQYLPGNGCSPPPFTEKVATYRVTIRAGRVLVDPTPLPRGTSVTPAPIAGAHT